MFADSDYEYLVDGLVDYKKLLSLNVTYKSTIWINSKIHKKVLPPIKGSTSNKIPPEQDNIDNCQIKLNSLHFITAEYVHKWRIFKKPQTEFFLLNFIFNAPCSNSGDIFGVSIIKSLLYSCLETCSCFTNKQPDVLSFSYLVPLLSFVLISIDKKKIFCHCTLRLCFAVLSCLHTMQPRCVGPSEKQKGQRSAYIFCIFKPDIKRIKQNWLFKY